MTNLLLKNGADPNASYFQKFGIFFFYFVTLFILFSYILRKIISTPLIASITSNQIENVILLLQSGANPNLIDG